MSQLETIRVDDFWICAVLMTYDRTRLLLFWLFPSWGTMYFLVICVQVCDILTRKTKLVN